jgi:hypothetical protein
MLIARVRAVTFAMGLAIAATACQRTTAPDTVIRADGAMERSVGGCFRIVTTTHAYQPLSIPTAFQVDGLAVHFEGRLRPTFNTCMAGDVVELLSITRRQ